MDPAPPANLHNPEDNAIPEMPVADHSSGKGSSLIKKICSVFFILTVVALSVIIYLHREKLQYVGSYGYIGIFVLCFICNATVFAPAPGLILIITASAFLNPLFVSLAGALGTTLGELTGYFSGKAGRNIRVTKNDRLVRMVQKYGSPVVFCFALLPLPLFDIIGVASGYLGIAWYKFIAACFFGKLIKMLCYAYGSVYFRTILIDAQGFLGK